MMAPPLFEDNANDRDERYRNRFSTTSSKQTTAFYIGKASWEESGYENIPTNSSRKHSRSDDLFTSDPVFFAINIAKWMSSPDGDCDQSKIKEHLLNELASRYTNEMRPFHKRWCKYKSRNLAMSAMMNKSKVDFNDLKNVCLEAYQAHQKYAKKSIKWIRHIVSASRSLCRFESEAHARLQEFLAARQRQYIDEKISTERDLICRHHRKTISELSSNYPRLLGQSGDICAAECIFHRPWSYYKAIIQSSLPPPSLQTGPINSMKHMKSTFEWSLGAFYEVLLNISSVQREPPINIYNSLSRRVPIVDRPCRERSFGHLENKESYIIPHIWCSGYHLDLLDCLLCKTMKIKVPTTTATMGISAEQCAMLALKNMDTAKRLHYSVLKVNADKAKAQKKALDVWGTELTATPELPPLEAPTETDNKVVEQLEMLLGLPLLDSNWNYVTQCLVQMTKSPSPEETNEYHGVLVHKEEVLTLKEDAEILCGDFDDPMWRGNVDHLQYSINKLQNKQRLGIIKKLHAVLKYFIKQNSNVKPATMVEEITAGTRSATTAMPIKNTKIDLLLGNLLEARLKFEAQVFRQLITRMERCRALVFDNDRCWASKGTGSVLKLGSIIRRLEPTEDNETEYVAMRCLGVGSFSEVWSVRATTGDMREYAAKITFLRSYLRGNEKDTILRITCREVKLHKYFNNLPEHPQMRMVECFEIAPHIFCSILEKYTPDLRMQLVINDSALSSNLIHNRYTITKEVLKYWLYDIFHCIEFLHGKGILHRDIKPANLLIDHSSSPPRLVLTDFGIYRFMKEVCLSTGVSYDDIDFSDSHEKSLGTVSYTSPEILVARQFSMRSRIDHREDMWQVGVVVCEILYRRRPLGDPTHWGGLCINAGNESIDIMISRMLIDALRYGFIRGPWVEQVDPQVLYMETPCRIPDMTKEDLALISDLLFKLICKHEARITPTEALNHPFLKGIER